MHTLKDQLPRIFQANLHRFYERVVRPGLDALPEPAVLEFGTTGSLDEFLRRAAAHVNNHTGNEAAKAYTLILSALFERQLRQWAEHLLQSPRTTAIQHQRFRPLLDECIGAAGIDGAHQDLRADLMEAHLVANVVRHGDGPACTALKAVAPKLWIYDRTEYVDINAGPSPASEQIRVRSNDVVRYVRAGLRFWGQADPLPMAVPEPPIR
jgi:hypothetical protein